jgi:hypothetical protein
MDLIKYTVEIEICAPKNVDIEDVRDYLDSLVKESDVAASNDIYAFGKVEITDEKEISIDEWNGEPVDEIDLEL